MEKYKMKRFIPFKALLDQLLLRGPFSIYEQPKYKPNLTLTLTLIQTLILILT